MRQTIKDRREQIHRDFNQLKALDWTDEDIYEELGKRYFLSPETIRQNVKSYGWYTEGKAKEASPGDVTS